MRKRPLLLLTNDDGVKAEGLRVLRRSLSRIARTIVFAPDTERSGTSHAFSLRQPLRVAWLDSRTASVGGTPTDCVMLAVRGLLRERPAMVVSGINHGPNLGDDVTYSGTVAAAMEGALLGLPSMAISAASWRDCRFGVAAVFARLLVLEVLKRGLPRNTLLNVNVPSVAAGEVRGVRVTRLGKRIYRDFIIKRVDPRSGRTYYLIDGEDPSWEKGKNTDFEAIEQGMISITPFHLDLTAHGHLRGFRRWERELSRGMRQLRC